MKNFQSLPLFAFLLISSCYNKILFSLYEEITSFCFEEQYQEFFLENFPESLVIDNNEQTNNMIYPYIYIDESEEHFIRCIIEQIEEGNEMLISIEKLPKIPKNNKRGVGKNKNKYKKKNPGIKLKQIIKEVANRINLRHFENKSKN